MIKVVFIGRVGVRSIQKEINGITMEYGVTYEAKWIITNRMYYIDNGIGGQNMYFKEDFMTLEQWRDSQLDNILR